MASDSVAGLMLPQHKSSQTAVMYQVENDGKTALSRGTSGSPRRDEGGVKPIEGSRPRQADRRPMAVGVGSPGRAGSYYRRWELGVSGARSGGAFGSVCP